MLNEVSDKILKNKITKKQRLYKNIGILILLLLISWIFILPFYHTNSLIGSDDMAYHVSRIYDLVNNIKHGCIYPYLYTYSFDKIGFPLGIFYPQITLIPIALLVILTGSYIKGIYAGIFLYTFLTVSFTYITARKFKYNKIQAVFAAIIYCFCSYRTADAFARFALGEFLGMVFLPLIVYGLYAVMYGDSRDWPYLVIGMGGVIFSHYLSTAIDFLIIFILFGLGFYWITNKKKRLKSWILTVISFIGEACIILIPFLIQEHDQKYGMPSPIPLQSHIPPFNVLFDYTINNSMERCGYYSIGIVLLFIIVWGLIRYNQIGWLNRVFITLGALLFIMCSSLFIWKIFNKTPLKVIQFPWRFFGIASIVLSFAGGSLIGNFFNDHTKMLLSQIFVFIGINLLIITPWFASVQQYITNNQQGKITASSPLQDLNCFYLSQFTPKSSLKELNNLKNHVAVVDGIDITLPSDEIQSIPNGLIYKSDILQNAHNVVLPEAIYSGLKVIQNNKEIPFEKGSGNRIKLKSTNSGPLIVKFMPTFTLYLSQWISIFTTITIIWLFFKRTIKIKKYGQERIMDNKNEKEG